MKIIIQDYQKNWATSFLQLRTKIKQALEPFTVAIEHIGSTSVEGLGAKPIIDILGGIENDRLLDQTIIPMQQTGFTYFRKYEPSWPERRYFVLLEPLSTKTPPTIIDVGDNDSFRQYFTSKAHIHVVVKDTHDWKRHIAFRDYLRVHPAVREEYYQLKKRLSELEFKDMLEYNDHKNVFIKEVEKAALDWYDKNNK
jgi:GrpB-like predicted nucleotidyltransferase (UPF0157 family)